MRGFTKFAVKLCICCHVDEKFKKASLLGVGSRRIELTGMGTVAEEEVSSWETGPATASSPTRTHRSSPAATIPFWLVLAGTANENTWPAAQDPTCQS